MTTPAAQVHFWVSTWQQPMPPPAGPARADVIAQIVAIATACRSQRLRVAVDGFTAAGKTTLGHELARALAEGGRPTFRASLDDFKRPWSEAHRYDRTSGEGYYRNAFDLDAIRRLLLEPAAPHGHGAVALCSIDPLTQIDHSSVTSLIPADGVLVVDGVFACRPELDAHWDMRVWVDVDAELSVQRGTRATLAGKAAPTRQPHSTATATSRPSCCMSPKSIRACSWR